MYCIGFCIWIPMDSRFYNKLFKMERGSQYCVLWNNYHSYLAETLRCLQEEGQLCDVTLVTAEGDRMNAHQLVLATCSTFFRNFIKDNSSKNSIVLLPSEIKFLELKAMVEFMYTGQVCIQQDRLQAFIRGARYFRIKGLEDSSEESEVEDLETSENEKGRIRQPSFKRKRIWFSKEEGLELEDADVPTTTVKGRTVKDHRYTQHVDLGDSDDNREKWEVVDRKPVIFPRSKKSIAGNRKRRRKLSMISKVPMHLSNNVICYERKEKRENHFDRKEEPINKVRRPGYLHEDDVDICTCSARKIWSVKDTEALLNAWMETLNQVPPSYFIRSMSLCRSVSKRLQQIGIQKNWKQCQVKMKNLRREVRLYKESEGRSNSKKSSEVANACEKLLTSIEDIFNKEEAIRSEWYQKRGERLRDDETLNNGVVEPTDILAQVAVLADSDMGDEDTDVPLLETEEGGVMTEGEEGIETYVGGDDDEDRTHGSHHQIHGDSERTVVHHIVEDISLHNISKAP